MSSLRKAFYHLQMAQDLFADEIRQSPLSIGGQASKKYAQRIDWMKKDFATHPHIPKDVAKEFQKEIADDILFPTAIAEKALLLPVDVREQFETMMDMLLKGEKLTIEHVKD